MVQSMPENTVSQSAGGPNQGPGDEEFGLTDKAAERIATLLQAEENAGEGAGEGNQPAFMRVTVEGGGCSGFQYKFSFESDRLPDDRSFTNGAVTVVVDEVSLDLVRGGRLDYVEELIGSYFQVVNPNAQSSCGCGTSFSI